MKVPLIDLKDQHRLVREEITQVLAQVMDEGSFIRGPRVEAFESEFARYCGAEYCVGLNSGTDALHLILKTLGVKLGDEVITVPFTFIATAESITNAGADVKFVDVDPERYTLDPNKLSAAITSKTVGIVPVHIFGMPADMNPILDIAKKHGLWVAEDACQAHGAVYHGKKAGTLGNAAAFSFYPSKNLGAYGDAGAVTTDESAIAQRIKMLRDHGQTSKYHSEVIGYNSRLDGFQAAILSIKLRHLEAWNKKRQTIAMWYDEALKDVQGIRIPKRFPDSTSVYHLYSIRAERRDALAEYLQKNGISTAVFYIVPVHQQTAYKNGRPLSLPVSEKLSQEILSLPMFPDLSRDQVDYVVEKIRAFYA